ncbi:MAG: YggS family pyridoxal phosphate-dependent enzyme [Firmicutes bacterium]|nr:YggS family pyridoxal phosphate-dependent enzyme [Bacillota bacterium]
MGLIADNVSKVMENIQRAARRGGRDPGEVRLVAVTKGVESSRVSEAVAAGVRVVGENRVQEARDKAPQVEGNPEWHLVGSLQTNKVRHALELFSMIQSLDSIKLARELDRRCRAAGRAFVETLLQVNVAREPTKHGVPPEGARDFIEAMPGFDRVKVVGLMVIPPYSPDPEASREWFRAAARLRDELREAGVPNVSMDHLSMGMSGDYEIAVEEGATIVRVGTAIFGARST